MHRRFTIRPLRSRVLPAAVAACLLAAGCGGGTTGTKTKPAAPQILGFVAADAQVVGGTGTTLTAYFTGGTGSVDGGVGPVTSGTGVTPQPPPPPTPSP